MFPHPASPQMPPSLELLEVFSVEKQSTCQKFLPISWKPLSPYHLRFPSHTYSSALPTASSHQIPSQIIKVAWFKRFFWSCEFDSKWSFQIIPLDLNLTRFHKHCYTIIVKESAFELFTEWMKNKTEFKLLRNPLWTFWWEPSSSQMWSGHRGHQEWHFHWPLTRIPLVPACGS